jgi:hypothetical protein
MSSSGLRDPRPFETERDLVRDKMRLTRILAIHRELDTFQLPQRVEQLLSEWDVLDDTYALAESDYMLRIAGHLCMEAGQAELWCRIFTAARDGCVVDPGDEMHFLDHSFDAP